MTTIVGTHDLALITLDTLRHDVAAEEFAAGGTPNLAALIPGGWEARHSPGTFTDPRSFENQITVVERALARLPADRRAFTFVNVAALHQPNHFYLPGHPPEDSRASHAAALRHVDAHLPRLFAALRRAPLFAI